MIDSPKEKARKANENSKESGPYIHKNSGLNGQNNSENLQGGVRRPASQLKKAAPSAGSKLKKR